jgi:hypothetical protein
MFAVTPVPIAATPASGPGLRLRRQSVPARGRDSCLRIRGREAGNNARRLLVCGESIIWETAE